MKILNFGSINIDYVYEVENFVKSGETIPSKNFQTFLGGKGLNQSVALAHAGAKVYHADYEIKKEGYLNPLILCVFTYGLLLKMQEVQ